MPKTNITAKFCRDVKPPETGRTTWTDEKLTGFCLTVSASGVKTFYRVGRHANGVTRTRIDTFPKITVDLARELCIEMNGEVVRGDHPRARKAKGRTLGEVWEWFWENKCNGVLRSSGHYWNTWHREFQSWGKLPLTQIERSMVEELVTKLRDRPGAVNVALTVLRALFECAIMNNWFTGKNPTAGVSKAHIPSRERFLLPGEIPKFFTALQDLPQDHQDIILVALYTGARSSNVHSMRWEEIDRDSAAWRIPSHKSKNISSLRIILTREVVEIINRRWNSRKSDEWVFPSKLSKTGHIVDVRKSREMALKKVGIENLKMHDLRRTLASWQALSGDSLQIIGATLGHKAGSTATGVYARLQDSTVRESVQNAVLAIQNTVAKNNSENAEK